MFALLLLMIPAEAAYGRVSVKRGGKLMWTTDTVDFFYSNGKVTSSSGFQTAGWIFPNIARNAGIVKYYSTSGQHSYRATNVYGAGVPSPWGDVKVYNTTYVHRLHVYGNGRTSTSTD